MNPTVENHARNPRFKQSFGSEPTQAWTHGAVGDNPFCGDTLEIRLLLKNADGEGPTDRLVIENAAFDGYACSLCTAAADVLLEQVRGLTVEQARAVDYDRLLELLDQPPVGRTRSGCVRLPLTMLARALG